MNASDIIERLGGPEELVRLTGLSTKAIWQWERRGIPGRWHIPLLDFAEERGIDLARGDLTRRK